jgi:hypothetical protein
VPNPDRRKFVNPLTQPTTDASTDTATLPSTESQTLTDTYTSTLPQAKHRKRGAQAFEHTHERITLWIDKQLKQRFEDLAGEQGTSKTQLLNEAIGDLLKKYEE